MCSHLQKLTVQTGLHVPTTQGTQLAQWYACPGCWRAADPAALREQLACASLEMQQGCPWRYLDCSLSRLIKELPGKYCWAFWKGGFHMWNREMEKGPLSHCPLSPGALHRYPISRPSAVTDGRWLQARPPGWWSLEGSSLSGAHQSPAWSLQGPRALHLWP